MKNIYLICSQFDSQFNHTMCVNIICLPVDIDCWWEVDSGVVRFKV